MDGKTDEHGTRKEVSDECGHEVTPVHVSGRSWRN